MRRHNQNNDNRYYAYLPAASSTSSRNSSSNSTNRNTHYQYYDPRLRTQQQTQKNLYEYQYSSTSPNRSSHSLYGSPRHQHQYQPPSFFQELPSLSTDTVADLGEPISIFDDIGPIEHRRSVVTVPPPIPSAYVPPDPSRRPSVSDVRLATAHVLREQLLTDIQRSINDIDRDLTSLERRPSGPRYMPPRFSPIIELDNQDDNHFRQTTTNKSGNISIKKPIPIITSPVHKQIQQTSARSTPKERNSGSSQFWPNKPKRIYEVIPSLASDSRKTSRQSSVGGQHEQIKISEIQSPQSPSKLMEKKDSLSNLQLSGQYHYGPEVEEIEILSNDPENIDHRSMYDEMQDASFYEILNTDQFLRDLSVPPQSRALIFVPEFSGNSQIGQHELTEDFISNEQIDTNIARSLMASSLHDLTLTKELIIQDTESIIQTAPKIQTETEIKPRIDSRNTISSHELYHKTEADLTNQSNLLISEPIKYSRPSTKTTTRTSPIVTENILEKSPSLQMAIIDSTPIVPLPPPTDNNNVSGLVAYFFSDFGNEGEGEEDIVSIDQSNFAVPTGAEIIADDDISSSLMGQSQASLLILHSAHVPRQQQQLTSPMPLTIENNNEHIKAEEKENEETDVTKKRIATSTSILRLPSSSSSPKQVLPTSIIGDMQTQFTRNNSTNNDDHHRQPLTTTSNIDTIDSNIKQEEKHSNNLQFRLLSPSLTTSQMDSRIQSTASERNETQIKKNNEETHNMSPISRKSLKNIDNEHIQTFEKHGSTNPRSKSSSKTISRNQSATSNHTNNDEETHNLSSISRKSLKNIDNEHIQTPERNESTEPRLKSLTKTSLRSQSTASNHTKTDEEITRTDSPTKTSLKNIDREYSPNRRIISRQSSITPSEPSYSSRQKSPLLRPSSTNHEINQPLNIHLFRQSTTTPIDDDIHKTPTNENEKPNTFSADSEHFLHGKPSTSYDLNQRLPSGYSVSPPPTDSRRSSTASSALPITLDSPDIDNNQPTTSRTTTPMRKSSISPIDTLPDPNILLTTTDEPDPNDPSIINSTLHLQRFSSQQPNTDISVPERNEPSPLVNMVPLQTLPTPIQSVELPSELLPTEDHLHVHTPIAHHNQSDEVIPESNNKLLPASSEGDVHLEQEERLHQTPSPSKTRRQQESSRQSPLLSYPARLEDLMRPTPSPFLSAHEHKHHQKQQEQKQEQEQTDRLSSVSPPIRETKKHIPHHHHQIHQNLSKFQHNNERSPSSSPPRTPLSDANHTSVEGDDTYRQQLDTPLISSQNERIISPAHTATIDNNNNNNHYPSRKQNLMLLTKEPPFFNENQSHVSSEKSIPSRYSQSEQRYEEHLHRNDIQLSSASIKFAKHHSSHPSSPPPPPSLPPVRRPSNDEVVPTMTASQQHSKLSLRLRQQEPKRKKSIDDHSVPPSSLQQIDTTDMTLMNTDDNQLTQKSRQQRRRRVSFSSSIAHFEMEDRQLLTNWRERVAAILASKHGPNDKYSHIQSRVNSFANFEYQPKKIKVLPKKKSYPKITTEQTTSIEENKFIKRKKFKVKKPKIRQETYVEDNTDDEQQIQPAKEPAPQLFGRLWCLPDGSPTVFHEALEWDVPSKLRGYSYENLNYEPQRNEFKIFNKKPKWQSESKLADLIKDTPRLMHRQILIPTNSLPAIPDRGPGYFYQQESHKRPETETERKIFDIQTNIQHQLEADIQHQSETKLRQNFSDNMSYRSYGSRPSDIPIFNERLSWKGKSKIKDRTWENVKYKPKKSKVQIFHKTVHWNSEPKIRTRSPSTIHPSRASMSNVQIFDQKLNWDAQAKVHCWSEIDLRQLTKKKAIFAQYHDPKWNDIVTARINTTNYNYPRIPHHVEIFSDRPMWTKGSGLKDYVWENFDYKSHRQTRQKTKQEHLQDIDQTPPNRPKWNAVSKTRSVNSVYNPKVTNSNTIRRGWDRELRRKRVHKLPPLKRKREHEEIPQLAIDAPPTHGQLAIDYNYDHLSTTQGRTTSNGYATTSSRRSSKALVPINHHRRFFELELPTETPRSQRPVQQEWYDEMNKSRLTHRTDMGRVTNQSFRNSIDSLHKPNTPRELATFRSSTRNSQNSVMSGTLLDSSVRTNRATEFRLSKDMEEHHHHSHTPSQSMPIEIRGFKLEGTQLTVPDNATIRPLSNVSYRTSEQVKSHRIYPWSNLHPHGTSSRNSSLLPIAEFRRPSLDTTITEAQQLTHEE